MPDSLLNYMESLSSWYSYMKNFFKFQTTQEMLFGTLNKKTAANLLLVMENLLEVYLILLLSIPKEHFTALKPKLTSCFRIISLPALWMFSESRASFILPCILHSANLHIFDIPAVLWPINTRDKHRPDVHLFPMQFLTTVVYLLLICSIRSALFLNKGFTTVVLLFLFIYRKWCTEEEQQCTEG